MNRMTKKIAILAVALASLAGGGSAQAAVPDVGPFPIGIFWSPSPEETTSAKYQEIKEMNATYVFLSNGVYWYAQNDAALAQCAAQGLKCIVQDDRLGSYKFTVGQTAGNDGKYVSSGNSLGQTFKTPDERDVAIDTIQLYIDKSQWTTGRKLTLSLYSSPSKEELIGSDSITGPVTDHYPVFKLYKWLAPSTTYYFELTSDSASNIGWVVGNTADVYAGGTAYQNGTALANYDFWFKLNYGQKMYSGGEPPSTATVNDIVAHYSSNPGLLGYNLMDEPSASAMTGLHGTMEKFRQADPNHMTYVNLLPTYAANLGFGARTGEYVTPSRALGQSFKTNAGTTHISTIQLYIDNSQWASNEPLTLKLWDSAAKTTLLGQSSLSGSSTSFPRFEVNAAVSPNTVYYWELTHGGGGDNSVGWVIRSTDGVKWEKDGTAYASGTPINGDFWFALNQNLLPFSYEDYVYRWASKEPDVLMFDHYPYNASGGFSSEYYTNLEIIRRQAQLASLDFWTYIQSVGITDGLRSPSGNELRYNVYTSLAYGAKGINYFTYETPSGEGESFHDGIILPDGSKGPLYTWVKAMNADLLKMGPTLRALDSEAVYHTGTLPPSTTALPTSFFWQPVDPAQPLIVSTFKNASGREYVMVVNRDTVNARTVSFALSTKPAAVTEVSKATGLETGTNYNASTGLLSSSFAPGEGRLYVLP
ncbi:beta-galactosidase [Paenibacillus sp. GCM10027626]|uniref:beta-galactosidase n=1 Tax=Paenibacillus sp. GCM10027626 TaxID=3273411 RepID=UPI0036266510